MVQFHTQNYIYFLICFFFKHYSNFNSGVNFIPIYDNGEPATLTSTNGSIFSQSFSLPSATTSQTPIQHDVNSLFTKSKPGHPKATTGFSPNSTKTVEPNQPFVTIKRVSDPSACDETVTISSYDKVNNIVCSHGYLSFIKEIIFHLKENKLLYTLVNGEIHRAEGAPETLIPRAKPWTAELTTKLSVPKTNTPRFVEQFTNAAQGVRPPLPTDSEGKLDLERLQLPPGISITKIQGPVPERKFFPEHDQVYSVVFIFFPKCLKSCLHNLRVVCLLMETLSIPLYQL